MDKYGQALINSASKLDAVTDACGEITKLATAIVEERTKSVTIALLKKISGAVNNPKYKIEVKRVAQAVNSNLIEFYGYSTIQSICKPVSDEDDDTRTLEDLLDELNALVGLEKVKEKVQDLIVYQKVQKMRREKNLHSAKNTLHLAFTGNPGTGKQQLQELWVEFTNKLACFQKDILLRFREQTSLLDTKGRQRLK